MLKKAQIIKAWAVAFGYPSFICHRIDTRWEREELRKLPLSEDGYRRALGVDDAVAAALNAEWAGTGVRVHALVDYYQQGRLLVAGDELAQHALPRRRLHLDTRHTLHERRHDHLSRRRGRRVVVEVDTHA